MTDFPETVTTWADGFGNWHAMVDITVPGNPAEARVKAQRIGKRAILLALAEREQTTTERLQQAIDRINASLGTNIEPTVTGKWHVFEVTS